MLKLKTSTLVVPRSQEWKPGEGLCARYKKEYGSNTTLCERMKLSAQKRGEGALIMRMGFEPLVC